MRERRQTPDWDDEGVIRSQIIVERFFDDTDWIIHELLSSETHHSTEAQIEACTVHRVVLDRLNTTDYNIILASIQPLTGISRSWGHDLDAGLETEHGGLGLGLTHFGLGSLQVFWCFGHVLRWCSCVTDSWLAGNWRQIFSKVYPLLHKYFCVPATSIPAEKVLRPQIRRQNSVWHCISSVHALAMAPPITIRTGHRHSLLPL